MLSYVVPYPFIQHNVKTGLLNYSLGDLEFHRLFVDVIKRS
jgi:hypothetical protein